MGSAASVTRPQQAQPIHQTRPPQFAHITIFDQTFFEADSDDVLLLKVTELFVRNGNSLNTKFAVVNELLAVERSGAEEELKTRIGIQIIKKCSTNTPVVVAQPCLI